MTTEARKQKQRDKRNLKRQWKAVDKALGLDKATPVFITAHQSGKQERVVTRWQNGIGGRTTKAQQQERSSELLRREQAALFARLHKEANK
jgi:hypothetical protein